MVEKKQWFIMELMIWALLLFFVAMGMNVHLANVGLYVDMLTFGVVRGLFPFNFLQLLLL
jgi:hypothetical protein